MRFKKLFIIAATLVLGMNSLNEVKAEEIIHEEVEPNNTSAVVNEVVMDSEELFITGKVEEVAGESDWFRVTCINQGKLTLSIEDINNPINNDDILKRCMKVYDSNFAEIKRFDKGVAHDEDDVIYIQVISNVYGLMTEHYEFDYKISLSDDMFNKYVSQKYSNINKAYKQKESEYVYTLGEAPNRVRYFQFEVPKGKRAIISIKPVEDANSEVLTNYPFKFTVTQKSTGSKIVDNTVSTTRATLSSYTKNNKTMYFSGSDTYYISIYGGSDIYPNYEWCMVKYNLIDYDTTKPTIKGVSNDKTYKKPVVIKYSDASGIRSATLNGKSFKSGKKVSKSGNYTVRVTDKNGNTKTVKFKIK